MQKQIAAFSFVVATMWIVIAVAEAMTGGGAPVVVTSALLAGAFLFAGVRLWRRTSRQRSEADG